MKPKPFRWQRARTPVMSAAPSTQRPCSALRRSDRDHVADACTSSVQRAARRHRRQWRRMPDNAPGAASADAAYTAYSPADLHAEGVIFRRPPSSHAPVSATALTADTARERRRLRNWRRFPDPAIPRKPIRERLRSPFAPVGRAQKRSRSRSVSSPRTPA
jgi:hypothetical protein